MRNKIDLSLTPDEVFANPWQAEAVQVLSEPEFTWRDIPFPVIEGFALSAHDEINHKLNKHIGHTRRHRRFARAIEYSTVPIVVERASFRKSQVLQDQKVILAGASGVRAINQYRATAAEEGADAEADLSDYFKRCREENQEQELSVFSGHLENDVHFAIPCRNTFNYYHFVTEALSQLTILDGLNFRGDIFFHYPNTEDKTRTFTQDFVDALFPEFRGRVHFERVPKDYDRVVTGFDLLGCCEQAPGSDFSKIHRHAPKDYVEKGGVENVALKSTLSMNGVSTAISNLRKRALRAIEGRDFSYLPKRLYVGRAADQSRPRLMAGEDLLFEHLELFGFEYVLFEALSPLEQIAIMAQAEVVVSCHGAGFTNMLFANPDAYIIELGTLQTAQYRWGDFWPLAHASQCKYISFFCDFKSLNPRIEPDFSRDGIVPVSMSDHAVAHVTAFIVALLEHYPKLSSVSLIGELARQLVAVDAVQQAIGLMDAHPGIAQGNEDLCLVLADAYKKLDNPKLELLALDKAHKANTKRWQTLVRIIWCANRCERPQVIRRALSRLERDFPERHEAFVSNHEWVRFVA